ncbi:mitochondrial large subunit ribosomal protein-domain-containing protein [Rhypophila decipiens]|uniref:Large ribosomal subunit protein mL49 n=1 Tax=Rhypophila decipiens TaxID=261697 RepID=A0AAN6Y3U4_9PEZI|nr:mitochondrial large subunit ribosomal protein-domain-containing protein [Rhypophila decipiens]
MLRPTNLSRAALPLQQLKSILPKPQPISIIHQQLRPKSTINKHRLPKKKFLALREQLAAERGEAQTPAAESQPEPAQAEPLPRGPPPFVISRTASLNLPIYLESKRGGNKKLTLIRKLEGDRTVLAQWLAEDLGLDRKKVRVKAPTNHVEVEGQYVDEVRQWFEARGF